MIEAAFKNALEAAGLATADKITANGRLQRFHVKGDGPGSKNGWYILFSDGLAAGAFGSWRTGERGAWCAKAEQTLTPAERAEYRQRMETARQARESKEQASRLAAGNKAITLWKAAAPAPEDHPYLVNKGIGNYGLRLHRGSLVIPLRDGQGGLHSLQFIDADGNKRFLSGGRKKGCYFPIGKPLDQLCIAEGYATAASIYEATGLPCAVAFDAGNLEAVAMTLRAKFPSIEITLCADNDTQTPGNPGLTRAREAAAACGALLAVPPCHGDFNDLYKGNTL